MRNILSFVSILTIVVFVFIFFTSRVSAVYPTASVNSFELFWPMVSGKVRGDRFYSIKLLKENVRGSLVFSSALKANYNVFLSVKRTLEAEALLKSGKKDLAEKTIDSAISELKNAKSNSEKAINSKQSFSGNDTTMVTRLENLGKLTGSLAVQYPDSKAKLDDLGSSAKSVLDVLSSR